MVILPLEHPFPLCFGSAISSFHWYPLLGDFSFFLINQTPITYSKFGYLVIPELYHFLLVPSGPYMLI